MESSGLLAALKYYSLKVYNLLATFDYFQIIPLLALLTIGVLFIYGTGQQIGIHHYEIAYKKQLTWIILGSVIWLILSLTDYRKFSILTWPVYGVSLILLTLVLFIGKVIFGAQRWISIAGINFQPSELGKMAALLALAWIMSRRGFIINRISSLIVVCAAAGLPFVLILIEPDLGSSLVIIAVSITLIFSAGLNWKIIAIPIAALFLYVAAVESTWLLKDHPPLTDKNRIEMNVKMYFPFLKGYQRERILVFLDPTRDLGGQGWGQYQAQIAVGSGGLFGKGFMQGTQNRLGFIPQTVSNSDFIFPVIAEEWGFVGAGGVVLLYMLLVGSAVRTSLVACDLFGRYIAIGTAAVIFSHSIVNIGMSIRLMPVTGLPLPFLSYGGTFVVISMTYLGFLQSIYKHRAPLNGRNESEATRITNTRLAR